MKKFKGKFHRKEEDNKYTKESQKSFRKTGKNLLHFDPDTIFVPSYKTPKDYIW
jgi:hypothetical protein